MILFDKQMVGKEWEINQLTQPCRKLLCSIARFCEYHDYHVYLTCVFRSDEEQRALYSRLGLEYQPSVHSHWRGFDFRMFPDNKFNLWLQEKINGMFPYDPTRPDMKSLLLHTGSAMHFHGQTMK